MACKSGQLEAVKELLGAAAKGRGEKPDITARCGEAGVGEEET